MSVQKSQRFAKEKNFSKSKVDKSKERGRIQTGIKCLVLSITGTITYL